MAPVRERVAAAGDPATPAPAPAALAADPARAVRRVVASRPDTPAAALRSMLHDADRQVRERLAVNPGCPRDALLVLLSDPRWSVRWTVIDNPAADVPVRLAAARSDDQDMRYILAQRHGLEEQVIAILLGDVSAEVRSALAERTDHPAALETLLTDPDPKVRRAAAGNPGTTAGQRHRLVSDPAAQVRSAVVEAKSIHIRVVGPPRVWGPQHLGRPLPHVEFSEIDWRDGRAR